MKKKLVWALITVAVIFIIFSGRSYFKKNEVPKSDLIIFHAGSLSVPLQEISELFEKEYPVTVKAEAAGSRTCARKISDLNRQCDVMASADYKVVQSLLMPEHADFNIRFATNEMVIAFTKQSALGNDITADNWHKILFADSVLFGRSDPNMDPCGYRTLMLFQLAEKYYKSPALAEKLTEKTKYIRPKETDLLALLEAGEIDYLFIYRSVAQQHGLKILTLPDQINLKAPHFANFYRSAKVKLTGNEPGQFIIRKGEPMIYSVTIPKNAQNKKYAEKWVEFLLSPKGRSIIEKQGQSCITPAQTDNFDKLPQTLKVLCQQIKSI